MRGMTGGQVQRVGEIEARLEPCQGTRDDGRMIERELLEVDLTPQRLRDRRSRHPVA